MIDDAQREKITTVVEESVDQGATLETGGTASGLFVEPTVRSDGVPDMFAACNEHFGPGVPVFPFTTDVPPADRKR